MTAIDDDLRAAWAGRRRRLLRSLGDGLLLVPTAPQPLRNGDVSHPFRPGSDLHFLTGYPEPGAVLAVRKRRRELVSALFVLPRDPARETWDGPRYGTRGAVRHFGVDEAYGIGELTDKLAEWLQETATLHHTLGADRSLDERLFAAMEKAQRARRRRFPPAHPAIRDPRPEIAALRAVKDRVELDALRRAVEATLAGHRAAMAAAGPGRMEYEVQAVLEKEFRSRGSRRDGYEPIVASGPNACILHYVKNDRRMRSGDLLLIDAGAEIDGVTADVTRTFPVSGAFTAVQAAVYRIVLAAQRAGIRAVRPGARWNAAHEACVRRLTKGLVELGVLRGDVRGLIRKHAYRPFYMHGTSHWLGRDVHDVGPYVGEDGKPVRLKPGMVLTVEPGLYFPPRTRGVPGELRGIGIRIEDDVRVTRNGHEVLTAALPTAPREIESLCARE